jgi:hypothetical protein
MSLEDLRDTAKRNIDGKAAGAAVGEGWACLHYDFTKPGAGTVGAKKTGLIVPAGTLAEVGPIVVNAATNGAFNLQLIASADLAASLAASAAGTLASTLRVLTGSSDREVMLNVTSAITTGKVTVWFQLIPV